MSLPLYLPQRPLSCCFDRKDFLAYFDPKGFLAVGLARGKNAARGEYREGEREKRGSALSLFLSFPAHPPKPNIIKKFPMGSLCGGGSPYPTYKYCSKLQGLWICEQWYMV